MNMEKLNKTLVNGETILWSGAPQPYSLFGKDRKRWTMRTLYWAVAWAIFSVGGYYALAVSYGTPISPGVILSLLAVCPIIIWMPVSDKLNVKKLSYAVTDKRAVVVSNSNDASIFMPLANITAIRIDEADNGNCHVRLGSPVLKMSARKLPFLAYRGEYVDQNDTKLYKGLVFFNVRAEDGKAIDKLLNAGA